MLGSFPDDSARCGMRNGEFLAEPPFVCPNRATISDANVSNLGCRPPIDGRAAHSDERFALLRDAQH